MLRLKTAEGDDSRMQAKSGSKSFSGLLDQTVIDQDGLSERLGLEAF